MKKTTLLSSLLTMTVILSAGCTKSQVNPDVDKIIADTNKQIEEALRNSQSQIDNIDKMMTQGGQPGTITLNGVAVMDADKLDTRITLSQTTGITRTGSETALAKEDLVVLNSLTADKLEKIRESSTKLEENRTYLNLGCEPAESEIAGLTEVFVESSGVSTTSVTPLPSASRVFICGEHDVSEKVIFSISASEIMLKDASLKMLKNPGGITLSAKTLVLVGKNKITTVGQNDSGILLSAASINLTVTNEIYGDGTLALESKGGNNIAEKKDSK